MPGGLADEGVEPSQGRPYLALGAWSVFDSTGRIEDPALAVPLPIEANNSEPPRGVGTPRWTNAIVRGYGLRNNDRPAPSRIPS